MSARTFRKGGRASAYALRREQALFSKKDSGKAGADEAEREGEFILTRDRVKEAGRELGGPRVSRAVGQATRRE